MPNKQKEFLSYLKDLYKQNPNLEINNDIIYSELAHFISYQNGKLKRVEKNNLVNVQVQLNNKYKNRVLCSSANSGYFFFIENREGTTDEEFYNKMYNSIKIYIACDTTNIYKVADSLFDFMLKEHIITQSKISKEMRTDCFIVRVSNKEEAEKVCNYVNSLKYQSTIVPNPFILKKGNVSLTIDGKLSYNTILASFLNNYLINKRNSNTLDTINIKDFTNYIKSEVLMCNTDSYYLYNNYGVEASKYNDFINISNILINNLNNTLTEEQLYKYKNNKNTEKDTIDLNNNNDKVLYIIYRMSTYYDIKYIHKVLVEYSITGNVNLFTRKDNIRNIVIDYLSPVEIKKVIFKLGETSLKEATSLTEEKYGILQAKHAITKFILTSKLEGFTRSGDARNKLGLILPKTWTIEILRTKLEEEEKQIFDMFINLPQENKIAIIAYIENKAKGNQTVNEDIERLIKLIDMISSNIYESLVYEEEKITKNTGIK